MLNKLSVSCVSLGTSENVERNFKGLMKLPLVSSK